MVLSLGIYESFRRFGEEPAGIHAEYIEELEKRKAITKEEHHESILTLTKEIKEVELRLTREIEKVRADLTKKIYQTKASLIKWLFVFCVWQVFAFVGILKWIS